MCVNIVIYGVMSMYYVFCMWHLSYGVVLFQWSDGPSPFKDCSTSLEESFGGRYEAAFRAPAQLLPDGESARTTPPASDATGNVFEKQDSAAEAERDVSAPPFKKSRHCLRAPPDLRGAPLEPRLSSDRDPEEVRDQLTSQKATERDESSSAEEQGILPQHSALCVC